MVTARRYALLQSSKFEVRFEAFSSDFSCGSWHGDAGWETEFTPVLLQVKLWLLMATLDLRLVPMCNHARDFR